MDSRLVHPYGNDTAKQDLAIPELAQKQAKREGTMLKKQVVLAFSVVVFFAFSSLNCEKKSEGVQHAADTTNVMQTQRLQPVQPQPDTTGDTTSIVQLQSEIQSPSLSSLEATKTEVESRLESLLSLIENKEKDLRAREERLSEREHRLVVETTNLVEKRKDLARLQVISWIVLGLGVVGIVVGLVLSGRSRNKNRVERAPTSTLQPEEKKRDEKAAYVNKTASQISTLNTKWNTLKTKAEKASARTRKELKPYLDEVDAKLNTARQKMDDLKKAGLETWQDFKKGVDKSVADFKKALENTESKMK